MYYYTWRGWQVQKTDENGRNLYLSKVYKGQPEWVTDYTYAKCFSEATAKKHNDAFVGDTPTDPWLKVLEDRVEEWQKRFYEKDTILKEEIECFKAWVSNHDGESIIYDTEVKYSNVKSAHSAYKFAWQSLGKAKDELAAYKKTMNL